MHEVKQNRMADTGNLVNEIDFEDFVRLYINHRPAFGVSADKLKKAFDTFSEEVKENSAVTRDILIKTLQEKGTGNSQSVSEMPISIIFLVFCC